MSPKGNLTLRWVSFSVFVVGGITLAVLGAILVIFSVCLIIAALNVSDSLTVFSTL